MDITFYFLKTHSVKTLLKQKLWTAVQISVNTSNIRSHLCVSCCTEVNNCSKNVFRCFVLTKITLVKKSRIICLDKCLIWKKKISRRSSKK